MLVHQALLLIHLAGIAVWVGGMAFAYFCLRPAAAAVLEPPQRLPLWSAALGRFFKLLRWVVAAVVLSGLAMLLRVGFANAPIGWHVMFALGLVMAAIFGHVDRALHPRLRKACAASEWKDAAAALDAIRRMVRLNLVLSVFTLVAAVSGR
jgi:uncharacterized membrane protein